MCLFLTVNDANLKRKNVTRKSLGKNLRKRTSKRSFTLPFWVPGRAAVGGTVCSQEFVRKDGLAAKSGYGKKEQPELLQVVASRRAEAARQLQRETTFLDERFPKVA